MTVSLKDAVSGTAAGVPFVALPPVGIEGPAPMVAVWHPLGPAGSPAAMAAAVPLRGLAAWRVYLGLPRTGERAVAPAPDADFVLDRYTPIVDQAAAEFPAAWAVLRESLPVGDGPVAVVGASAGGHAALTVLIRGEVPVAAAALINPAVRTESVVAVNERYGGFTYRWTAEARAAATPLDIVAAGSHVLAPVLLVLGEHEYPEFRPDQDALFDVLAEPKHKVMVPGMDHYLAEEPGAAEQAVEAWLAEHFTSG